MFNYREIIKKRFFIARISIIILLLLSGCLKDIPENVNIDYVWEPVLAFPIGEADFGLMIPHGFSLSLLERNSDSIQKWDLLDKVPLDGTIKFDFEEVLGLRENINSAMLHVNVYNGFPVDITIQAYLEDEAENVLDSLFNPGLFLPKAATSGAGIGAEVITTHTQDTVLFDQNRLDLLMETKSIRFTGELDKVAGFPAYTFKVQLGAKLGIISQLW